ncbi:MAG: exopolysaccharide biosynthesis protein [Thermodesulfobacteriota bacterium]
MYNVKEILRRAGMEPNPLAVAGRPAPVAAERHACRAAPVPVYTRTRVQPVAAATLAGNRIFAVDPGHRMADEIRLLRTQVLQRLRAGRLSTLLVTGFGHGHGASTVAANLAVSISLDARQTTLLVGLDFRRPTLERLFALPPPVVGLVAHFEDRVSLEEVFVNPGIDKLTLLPAGGLLPQAPEVLGSPRMEALVRELKERYPDRVIVFDAPSLSGCPDTLICSDYVDAILLVARAGRTSQGQVREAVKILPRGKVLGTVLNAAPTNGRDNGKPAR